MPIRNIWAIVVTVIVSMACYSVASKNRYANLFAEAMDIIDREALQDVPRDQLFDHAMKGMMSGLDEHSLFVSGDLLRAFNEDINQQFGGVGMFVDVEPESGRLIVLAPIPNTPAFEAGIRAGDEIIQINGRQTLGMSREDAIQEMRGPQGATVNVVIGRDGHTRQLTLKRAAIHVPSVHGDWRNPDGTWNYVLQSHPRIGYLRLLQFGKDSAKEMSDAINQINSDADALIVDMRNNAGGLLDAAVEISEMFLPEGKLIVSTRGRKGKLVDERASSRPPIFDLNKPLVILVDRNSASASEVVSACLQDHKRAVVVGESTWGKGTVQNIIPIEKDRSALKLTTASYWRPSGKYIDRYDPEAKKSGEWGVHPDPGLEVTQSEEMVFKNLQQRNIRDLRGLLKSNSIDDPNEDATHVDMPLQRAIDFIQKQLQNRVAA
jgi:carboxyl-terminal processing protease